MSLRDEIMKMGYDPSCSKIIPGIDIQVDISACNSSKGCTQSCEAGCSDGCSSCKNGQSKGN